MQVKIGSEHVGYVNNNRDDGNLALQTDRVEFALKLSMNTHNREHRLSGNMNALDVKGMPYT